VLEKHHVLRAFEVMVGQDIGLLKGLSSESYWDFRNAVAGCILATDFAKHAFYCEQVGPPSSSFMLSAEGKAAFLDHIARLRQAEAQGRVRRAGPFFRVSGWGSVQ
jgi:hypothetical protein